MDNVRNFDCLFQFLWNVKINFVFMIFIIKQGTMSKGEWEAVGKFSVSVCLLVCVIKWR